EPVVRPLGVHLQSALRETRIVVTDVLDEAPITRALRVGDHDTIERQLLPPAPAETNLHGHCLIPLQGGWYYTGSARPPELPGAPVLTAFKGNEAASDVGSDGCACARTASPRTVPLPKPSSSSSAFPETVRAGD